MAIWKSHIGRTDLAPNVSGNVSSINLFYYMLYPFVCITDKAKYKIANGYTKFEYNLSK